MDLALSIDNLSCGYDSKPVISGVTFGVAQGSACVLLGPNGVGKTTFMKTLLAFIPRIEGSILISGEDCSDWSRKKLAQAIAYVPQFHEPTFDFSVKEMVLMGRTPSVGSYSAPKKEDEEIADSCIEMLGLSGLVSRDCTQLSGGELQMVMVARALAQQPSILVMDEPFASLDMGNQVMLLEQIKALNEKGLAILLSSHDPNHALMLDSDVVCFSKSAGIRVGKAKEIITAETLSELYGVNVDVYEHIVEDGTLVSGCIPVLRK